MRKLIATILTAAMITTGCASASGPRVAAAPAPVIADTGAMAEYVQRLPAGSRVRVDRTDGTLLKGTLMKATAAAIVVQKNTRVPEPPIEIPLGQVARVMLENGSGTSTGKAVGIGIASGLGVFFGILAILAASWD